VPRARAGELGLSEITGRPLHYRGTLFDRVHGSLFISGGTRVGFPGESIYGPSFPNESFRVAFNQAGVLGMRNDSAHGNKCRFFITLAPVPHLNGQCVGFGRVLEGWEVVKGLQVCARPHALSRARALACAHVSRSLA
jgi:cyclophilin family peptidyl-prolyl cis-trans isomerase